MDCYQNRKRMTRGTTPTNTFKTTFPLHNVEELYITYAQNNKVKVEKSISDVVIGGDTITVTLTQEDTLEFQPGKIEIQCRLLDTYGKAVASNLIETTAEKVLKEGVIGV